MIDGLDVSSGVQGNLGVSFSKWLRFNGEARTSYTHILGSIVLGSTVHKTELRDFIQHMSKVSYIIMKCKWQSHFQILSVMNNSDLRWKSNYDFKIP